MDLSLFDVDATSLFQSIEFGEMGTGAVAARYEGGSLSFMVLSALATSFMSLMPAGSLFGPDQHKVIVHHPKSFHAFSFGEELCSADFACTNTTSASHRAARYRALGRSPAPGLSQ
jgi:hypothetical protein